MMTTCTRFGMMANVNSTSILIAAVSQPEIILFGDHIDKKPLCKIGTLAAIFVQNL